MFCTRWRWGALALLGGAAHRARSTRSKIGLRDALRMRFDHRCPVDQESVSPTGRPRAGCAVPRCVGPRWQTVLLTKFILSHVQTQLHPRCRGLDKLVRGRSSSKTSPPVPLAGSREDGGAINFFVLPTRLARPHNIRRSSPRTATASWPLLWRVARPAQPAPSRPCPCSDALHR